MTESEIEEMAIGNFKAAIDQQHDYDSLGHALDSYRNNAIETLVDLGVGSKDNFEIVNWVFDAQIAKLDKA